ncbi:hypothetical protein PybrP1_002223 [[Pythium] brassicae (nom. inval.)]|nr:hypothetical protein PybrP1_002223 [[Pythium] brassicae (nom. inval.)]
MASTGPCGANSRTSSTSCKCTATQKPPSRRDVCAWVRRAWATVASETIQAGFRHAGITEEQVDDEVVRDLEHLHLANAEVCLDDDI